MTRRVHCPVCDESTPGDEPCDCGYDFATRDPARAVVRSKFARRRAERLSYRAAGTLLTAAIPGWLLTHAPIVEQLELMTVIGAQLVLGTWWGLRAAVDKHVAQRRLRAAASLGELPAARVLE